MEKEPDYCFKLILVGSGGVGKTSLVRKYVEKTFSENYLPTIGAQIMGKEISLTLNGKKVRINLAIWDIAAQNTFKKMHSVFYAGAHGAFLVADFTRPDSLSELLKWNEELTSLVPNVLKLLLVNKSDLDPQISDEIIQEIGNKIQAIQVLKTSALSGKNVLIAFRTLTKQLIEKSAKILDRNHAKDEVEWRSTVQYLYAIDHSGILLHEQDLRQSSNGVGKTRDSSILSGALVAVSNILKDIAENANPLKVVSQEGFCILIEEGERVLAALVTTAELKTSRQKLQGFLKEFEGKFGNRIEKSINKGDIGQAFKSAGDLVQRIFNST